MSGKQESLRDSLGEDYFAEKEKEQIKKEKESEGARLAEIDRLTKDFIIPVKELEPLKVKEDPMHLNFLETELFRYFEVNRDNAYTLEGIFMDLKDPRTPPICYWIDPYNPKERDKVREVLKDMVLNRKLGGEYDKNKKDYFYFFRDFGSLPASISWKPK